MKKVLAALVSIGLLANLSGCVFPIPDVPSSRTTSVASENTESETSTSFASPSSTPLSQAESVAESSSTPQEEDLVLYDENGVRISYKEMTVSPLGYKEMKIEIQNQTQNNYLIQTRDVSVNGYMVSPVFSCNVSAGKNAIDEISFPSYELDEIGVTDIETIELTFMIANDDDWSDHIETNPITINFS